MSRAVTLTPSQAAVLSELRAVLAFPWVKGAAVDWVRPYHVRHFRGPDTEPEVQALSIKQVEQRLRALVARGLVEKRDRVNEYRIPGGAS